MASLEATADLDLQCFQNICLGSVGQRLTYYTVLKVNKAKKQDVC